MRIGKHGLTPLAAVTAGLVAGAVGTVGLDAVHYLKYRRAAGRRARWGGNSRRSGAERTSGAGSEFQSTYSAVGTMALLASQFSLLPRHQYPGYRGGSLGPVYAAGRACRSHPWKDE